eukprot:s4608_g7.t1
MAITFGEPHVRLLLLLLHWLLVDGTKVEERMLTMYDILLVLGCPRALEPCAEFAHVLKTAVETQIPARTSAVSLDLKVEEPMEHLGAVTGGEVQHVAQLLMNREIRPRLDQNLFGIRFLLGELQILNGRRDTQSIANRLTLSEPPPDCSAPASEEAEKAHKKARPSEQGTQHEKAGLESTFARAPSWEEAAKPEKGAYDARQGLSAMLLKKELFDSINAHMKDLNLNFDHETPDDSSC